MSDAQPLSTSVPSGSCSIEGPALHWGVLPPARLAPALPLPPGPPASTAPPHADSRALVRLTAVVPGAPEPLSAAARLPSPPSPAHAPSHAPFFLVAFLAGGAVLPVLTDVLLGVLLNRPLAPVLSELLEASTALCGVGAIFPESGPIGDHPLPLLLLLMVESVLAGPGLPLLPARSGPIGAQPDPAAVPTPMVDAADAALGVRARGVRDLLLLPSPAAGMAESASLALPSSSALLAFFLDAGEVPRARVGVLVLRTTSAASHPSCTTPSAVTSPSAITTSSAVITPSAVTSCAASYAAAGVDSSSDDVDDGMH